MTVVSQLEREIEAGRAALAKRQAERMALQTGVSTEPAEPAKPKRTRKPKAAPAPEAVDVDAIVDDIDALLNE